MASRGPPGMPTRWSTSRPDSSGSRKDIPLTANSLDLLNPSPEQSTAGESRPSSAGPPRCKTPVGGAAPPRRTSSANRYANIQVLVQQPQQQQQQHGGLPDDDSLVLYKDPTGLSMQQSVASVASGRHQEGETFFTALRRSFSSGSESELEQQEAAAGGLSFVDSQANPMCSPSTSAFFSARDERSSFCSAGGSLPEDYSQAASLATCESSSTLYHEAADGAGLAPSASVMDVINSLYFSHASAGASTQQQPKWRELDPDGRPLMQLGTSAAATTTVAGRAETPRSSSEDDGGAVAPHAQSSCASSVGSWDPAVAGQATAAAVDPAVGQQQQAACRGTYAATLSSAASATSAAGAVEPESSSSSFVSASAESSAAADEKDDGAAAAVTATGDDEPGAAEDGAADVPDNVQQQDGGGGDEAIVGDDHAHAAACLAQVQEQLDSRVALQAELSGYVAGLTTRLGDDGEQLVTLPADYQLMVERLLQERRSQYRALEGWEGPRRFDELPVAQLPASHDDPRIAAGLKVIRQLDEQLKEAWIKAQVAARGSNPEQWAAAERERFAARAAQLDEALARERQKRLHAARLLRALHKLDEQQQADDALLLPGPCKGLSSYSYYKLQPQEEQLLAAVLGRDDADLEQHNPFDASMVCLDAEECDKMPAADEQQAGSSGAAESASSKRSSCTAASPAAGNMQPSAAHAAVAAEAQQATPAAVPKFAGSCCYSGRPSSEGSSRSVASGSSKAAHTLAEIDALLEALQADHCCAGLGPGLGSSRPSIATLSSAPGSRRTTITKDAAPVPAGASAMQHTRKSSASGASSMCSGAGGQVEQQQQQQRDYVREQREAKELQQREQEVDAQLRALRMRELPDKLQPEQLQALLQQCRQMLAATSSVAALS